jgi:hypothetical protein
MSDSDAFDLEALRIGENTLPIAIPPRPPRPRRPKSGEAFLAGPIPWNWLLQAGGLPGCALHVGLVHWRESKMKRTRTVSFCLSHVHDFGKLEGSARRGLRALEGAGLIVVKNNPGQCAVVTILDVATEPSNSGQTSGSCTHELAGTLLLPGS